MSTTAVLYEEKITAAMATAMITIRENNMGASYFKWITAA
jgi:hypothetical protein